MQDGVSSVMFVVLAPKIPVAQHWEEINWGLIRKRRIMGRTASVSINMGDLTPDDSSIQEPPICNAQSFLSLVLFSFTREARCFESLERSCGNAIILDPVANSAVSIRSFR